MARERMVTRTIKMDKVMLLAMDKDTRIVCEVEFRVNGEVKHTDAEIIEKFNDTNPGYAGVMVLSHDVQERLFSMSEELFMFYATEGPARGEKEDA